MEAGGAASASPGRLWGVAVTIVIVIIVNIIMIIIIVIC